MLIFISMNLLILLLLLLLTTQFPSPAFAENQVYQYHLCSSENFTANSPYSSNLNLLLSTLSSTLSSKPSASSSAGNSNSSRVYGLAFCRADIPLPNCTSCFSTANSSLLTFCPNTKGAAIWFDHCQLFYEDQDIIRNADVTDNYQYVLVNPDKVPPDISLRFVNLTVSLMKKVSDLAARNALLM